MTDEIEDSTEDYDLELLTCDFCEMLFIGVADTFACSDGCAACLEMLDEPVGVWDLDHDSTDSSERGN